MHDNFFFKNKTIHFNSHSPVHNVEDNAIMIIDETNKVSIFPSEFETK